MQTSSVQKSEIPSPRSSKSGIGEIPMAKLLSICGSVKQDSIVICFQITVVGQVLNNSDGQSSSEREKTESRKESSVLMSFNIQPAKSSYISRPDYNPLCLRPAALSIGSWIQSLPFCPWLALPAFAPMLGPLPLYLQLCPRGNPLY